jgi:uncharacterized protein
MTELGKINTLIVCKRVEFGVYLDGGEAGEILVPNRYISPETEIGNPLDVFVYKDSEDRIIATTEVPFAMAGECTFLEVVSVDQNGAFLSWGIMKDLFVPFREQKEKMITGKKYIVRIYIDEVTQRLAASAKFEKFLDIVPPEFTEGQEVDVLIANKTDLGFKVIINNSHSGIIYQNEIFGKAETGMKLKAYIKKVRDDGKTDISLSDPGFGRVRLLAEQIINKLREQNGFLNLNDNSSPEEIYRLFSQSKKTFKKALGILYKERKIILEENGIRLQEKKF